MNLNERHCEKCHFGHNGRCRRFPPQFVYRVGDTAFRKDSELRQVPGWEWPRVHSAGWCGEWKERATQDTKTPASASDKG